MVKKVILLKGKPNRGKSHSLLKVYQMLIRKYDHWVSNLSEHSNVDDKLGKTDTEVTVTIKRIKIGIQSEGDQVGKLKKSLKLFRKYKCKVIICASRPQAPTYDAVKKLEQYGYQIMEFEQNEETSKTKQVDRDVRMAKQIFREIEKVLLT
jgi:hypothetical protein